MFLNSACSCLRTIYWSQRFSGEWRCSWSSADRRCSNYMWVINNFIAYSKSKSKSKIFYYNKIIIIHRMTQRLKPIWIYLSQKFLPLFTLQRPHFDDNSVSTGASTEAVWPMKLRHSRHKLHWNRSTDSSATSDGKTDTTMAAPLQWTTMMPNIEV